MDEIKHLFRESLKTHIDALEAARKSLQTGDPDALDSVRRIAHTLRGSAGTVGYGEISETAARLEDAEDQQVEIILKEFLSLVQQVATEGEEQKYSILIIEDDPVAAQVLRERLSAHNHQIFTADTAALAKKILGAEKIDLILLDLILPDTDGRTLLVELRERPEWARIPVVVESVKSSPAVKAECFALGADDYFEKPVDLEVLAMSIAARLKRSSESARESRTDPLTGLPNRAAFLEAFQRAQSLAARSGERLSLAILDLDKFKSLNDTYGHNMGDEVLRRVRPVISEALRQTDFIARWGGEEFVVLFPNADTAGAAGGLRKALDVFRDETFDVGGQTVSQVTFSAGVTEVSEEAGVEECVAAADRLLYLAKENGRNQVLTEEIKTTEKVHKILLAEDDEIVVSVVRHRLEREGFEVVSFPDGRSALEAAQDLEVSLAILDVKMPGMDGFELLAHLRKMATFRDIPIMMLTSMGGEEDIVRGFELGADDYVMKPFSSVELLARIRRLIRAPTQSKRAIRKVLLVDDDPIIRKTASKALEVAGGFEVVEAGSVEEGWVAARKERPDLIVIDFILPDMDGTELLDRLQGDEFLRDIPVVFLTAKTDPALMEDLNNRGIEKVLRKPFEPSEFVRQLQTVLKSSVASSPKPFSR